MEAIFCSVENLEISEEYKEGNGLFATSLIKDNNR